MQFPYSQPTFLRFTVILFHSKLDEIETGNEQKVRSNKQKITSNEQKVTRNKQKSTSNKQKLRSNAQKAWTQKRH